MRKKGGSTLLATIDEWFASNNTEFNRNFSVSLSSFFSQTARATSSTDYASICTIRIMISFRFPFDNSRFRTKHYFGSRTISNHIIYAILLLIVNRREQNTKSKSNNERNASVAQIITIRFSLRKMCCLVCPRSVAFFLFKFATQRPFFILLFFFRVSFVSQFAFALCVFLFIWKIVICVLRVFFFFFFAFSWLLCSASITTFVYKIPNMCTIYAINVVKWHIPTAKNARTHCVNSWIHMLLHRHKRDTSSRYRSWRCCWADSGHG